MSLSDHRWFDDRIAEKTPGYTPYNYPENKVKEAVKELKEEITKLMKIDNSEADHKLIHVKEISIDTIFGEKLCDN